MKFKTTSTELKNEIPDCYLFRCGYCLLQEWAQHAHHEPIAYASGIYGWNYDVYKIGYFYICTGYRGMPGIDLTDAEIAKLNQIWRPWEDVFNEDEKTMEILTAASLNYSINKR